MARKHPTRLILIALLFAAACDDPAVVIDRVGPEIVVGSSCPNEADAPGRAASGPGAVAGDVDGDGTDDDVSISLDPEGEPGCRSFLVVSQASRDRVFTTAIDPSGAPRSLESPSINSLADIDGRAGVEIVVNIEAGASTQFVVVFTLTSGQLERLAIRGKGPGPFAGELGDLLAFGGSVGHLEAIDCTGDGRVVMSAATPGGSGAGRYVLERRFFVPEGAGLVLDRSLTERREVSAERVGDFPEFAGSPFGSCG